MAFIMTPQEIKENLKPNDYGEMVLCNKFGYHITCMGTVIFVSKKCTVVFYDNEKIEYFLNPEDVISFKPKDMLPPPTEHYGKPIHFDGGKWINTETGKEVKLDR
jgi:hypothetical protein